MFLKTFKFKTIMKTTILKKQFYENTKKKPKLELNVNNVCLLSLFSHFQSSFKNLMARENKGLREKVGTNMT